MNLDRQHLRILDLLQQDARMSVAELARRIGLAESTVRERLESLVHHGVIRTFRAEVDPSFIGRPVHAVVYADCDPRRTRELKAALEAVPDIVRVLLVTGARPLLVELRAPDMERIEHILADELAPLGVAPMELHMVTRAVIDARPPPMPELEGTVEVDTERRPSQPLVSR